MSHIVGEDLTTALGALGHITCGCTEEEQRHIHKCQTGGGYQRSAHQIAGLQARLRHALVAQNIDNQHTEHQGCQGIHGVVAFDNAFGQWVLDIVTTGCRYFAAGQQDNGHCQPHQQQNQHWGQYLAYAIHQFAGKQCQQHGHQKESQSVEQLRLVQLKPENVHYRCRVLNKRQRANLIGYQTGTRRRECWANNDIDSDCQSGRGKGRQQLHHLALRLGHSYQTGQRQTHGGNQKANHGHWHVFAGQLPGKRRKNQVARPQEKRKGHESQAQGVTKCQLSLVHCMPHLVMFF